MVSRDLGGRRLDTALRWNYEGSFAVCDWERLNDTPMRGSNIVDWLRMIFQISNNELCVMTAID